jgi:hypothetical protein
MKAYLLVILSVFDFVHDESEKAKTKLIEANKLDQREYRLRELQLYTNRIAGDNGIKALFSSAARIKKIDQVQLLKNFLKFVKTINV